MIGIHLAAGGLLSLSSQAETILKQAASSMAERPGL